MTREHITVYGQR